MESSGLVLDGLQAAAYVLFSDRLVGRVSIVVIVTMAAVTKLVWSSLYAHLEDEAEALRRCHQLVAKHLARGASDAEVGEVIAGLPTLSAARQAVAGVWGVRHLPSPDIQANLGAIEGGTDARTRWLSSAPNTILLVGLLGTVAGLGYSVAGLVEQLSQVLDAPEPAALTSSLSDTLAEMQSAFSATIWGILGALYASHLLRRMRGQIDEVRVSMRRLVVETLAPRLLPASVEAQIDEITLAMRTSREYLGEVSTIMQNSAASFQTVLERTGSAMEANIGSLADVTRKMTDSLADLGIKLASSVDSLDGASREMKTSSDRLTDFHGDMRNAYAELGRLYQDAREHTDRQVLQQIEKVSSVQAGFESSTSMIVERLDAASSRVTDAIGAFRTVGEQQVSSINGVYLKLDEGFERVDVRMKQTLDGHRAVQGEVRDVVRDVAEAMTTLVAQIDPALFPSSEWRALREDVGVVSSMLGAIVRGIEEKDATQAVGAVDDVVAHFGGLADRLDEIHEALTDIRDRIVSDAASTTSST